MTARELAEYTALRDTIRERGTTRLWIVLAGLTAWGGLVVVTAALAAFPAATVLPLLILATAFEIVFALHMGVERIGRYIQVFYEDGAPGGATPERDGATLRQAQGRGWEHTAMTLPGFGVDPLFSNLFRIAAVFNLVPSAFARPIPLEWVVVGAIHVLFIARVAFARRQAARQRAMDLERFQELKATT